MKRLHAATDTAPRTPHRGDPVLLYGDRRTVLDLIDRGMGLLIVAEDDAGLRIERYADRLTWDADARAWRAVAVERKPTCPQCAHAETEHHEPSWHEGFWWCGQCMQQASADGDDPRSVGPCR